MVEIIQFNLLLSLFYTYCLGTLGTLGTTYLHRESRYSQKLSDSPGLSYVARDSIHVIWKGVIYYCQTKLCILLDNYINTKSQIQVTNDGNFMNYLFSVKHVTI